MSRKTIIILVSIGVALFIVAIYFVFTSLRGISPGTPTALQFWGVYDEPGYYYDIINQYEKENPGIKIGYRKFTFEDYEESLINAFASGTGPDIWLMHNTWLPKHGDKISAMPLIVPGTKLPLMTMQDFQNQFVDVAKNDLTRNGEIYGLPLYIDTLALYYNKDIFNSVGIANPPLTWEDFNSDVAAITQFDNNGRITRAGAAIGTVKNINRSTDIMMLLMMQSGIRMTNGGNTSATFSEYTQNQNVGETALQYYTDFANPSKAVFTWDDQQHYSVDAFIEGKVAMMLNYSHQALNIHAKAPRFNFSISAAPQNAGASMDVNFANYWAATVSKQSKNPTEAWKFIAYLTNAQNSAKYLTASNRPPARRDLIESMQTDPEAGIFAKQALSAKSWYQVDNIAIESIFADMIDAVNYGRASIRDALQSAESKINVLMQKQRI